MQNVHQEITNQIVKSIENGNTKPWRCPWVGSGEPAFPANAITGNQYQGINVLLLWWAANEYGFSSNQWLTYKQAKGAGGHVIKGESGMKCLFYRKYETQDDKDPDKIVERYAANRFVLFNRDQVEGLKTEDLPTIIDDDARHESIDELAKPYLKSEKIRVIIGGNRACYSPSSDVIRMPKGFETSSDFGATLAHEVAHSTGHVSRLNRFKSNTEDFDSGKESYAFEELVAELTASFWCAKCGLSDQYDNHVDYLSHWLTALKDDPKFIFRAAKAADLAMNYIEKGYKAKY